jgi:hypothetical protein
MWVALKSVESKEESVSEFLEEVRYCVPIASLTINHLFIIVI